MRNQIRAIGKTDLCDYTTCFVRYDETDKLYHCQVGFYKIRKGAQKVADELESLGFDTYLKKDIVYL